MSGKMREFPGNFLENDFWTPPPAINFEHVLAAALGPESVLT